MYRQYTTYFDNSHHNECRLFKLLYLLNFQSWSTLTMSKRACSLYPPQYQFCVLLCNAIKSSKEALADTTWVQSTIATRSNYFEVDNMMYMGTINNTTLW